MQNTSEKNGAANPDKSRKTDLNSSTGATSQSGRNPNATRTTANKAERTPNPARTNPNNHEHNPNIWRNRKFFAFVYFAVPTRSPRLRGRISARCDSSAGLQTARNLRSEITACREINRENVLEKAL
jgi:hypothetical protein